MLRKAIVGVALMGATPALASIDLDDVVGYTLVAKKTAVKYLEDGKLKDGFEGCSYDRVIVFDDDTGLRCRTYNYNYEYRPDAYIFVRGSSIKMVVDDEVYDMASLR